jgi:iron complex outermembrane receptor protein
LLASAATFAMALAIGAPALAADAPASGTAEVQEVVVTAQKRAENVQTVPISMEVVSAKALEAFHATDFKSLINVVPNLSVETEGGNDIIYIRGFGSPPANYGFDQSVSLYVDGIYAGKSRQFQDPFFDEERVEVLRGPQGALFGKNTAAGAISIISASPTSTFQGAVNALYNFDFHGYETSGYVSGPITDALSARLAAKVVDEQGYIKNLATGKEEPGDKTQEARLTLKYAPTSTFDYTTKVEYSHVVNNGNTTVSSPLNTPQEPGTTRFAVDGALGPDGFATTSWNFAGTGNLHLGGGFTLTSITGYSSFKATHTNDFDQSLPGGGHTYAGVWNSWPENFQQVSEEVRLQSPLGGVFDYIVGAYYDSSQYSLLNAESEDILNFGHGPLPPIFSGTNFKQQAATVSAFGQGAYHVSSNFRILGSLRYTNTDKRGWTDSFFISGPFPLGPPSAARGKINEGSVDPSITLQYDLAPRVMVYAAYGQGSKSGGFVSNAGATDSTFTFKPEHSKNYEVGLKSTLFDGKVVLDAAIYDMVFDNKQVSVYNPTTRQFLTGNAAQASSKGIEAQAIWRPFSSFDISGSVAYQDAKYDNYPGAACLATESLSQCNPASPASIAANNIAGAPLPYVSKFSGQIQFHQVTDLPRDLKLNNLLMVSGRSKYFDADTESPLYGLQKGYAKIDARIELAPDGGPWHVALVGKNLTDQKTTLGAFQLPFPITAVPRAELFLEPTRNIALEAGVKF